MWSGANASQREMRRPLRILLAEDDPAIREALGALLRLDGHDVEHAESGAELLEALSTWILSEAESSPVDLIITDVRMPGVCGLHLVEGLRANGWRKPLVVMSAFGDPETRERVKRLGNAEFLPKPFDLNDLQAAIDRLIPEPGASGASG